MPQLLNIRHERFARFVAKGLTKTKAYELAGYTPSAENATRLWKHKGNSSERIQRRVTELLKDSSKLTATDILDHVYATFALAFNTEQCSAALKALEMLGKEHGIFRDRRENININLASMTWQQTEQYLTERYGDKAPKLIEVLKDHYQSDNTPSLPDELE